MDGVDFLRHLYNCDQKMEIQEWNNVVWFAYNNFSTPTITIIHPIKNELSPMIATRVPPSIA